VAIEAFWNDTSTSCRWDDSYLTVYLIVDHFKPSALASLLTMVRRFVESNCA
jgi:hypothetical protein